MGEGDGPVVEDLSCCCEILQVWLAAGDRRGTCWLKERKGELRWLRDEKGWFAREPKKEEETAVGGGVFVTGGSRKKNENQSWLLDEKEQRLFCCVEVRPTGMEPEEVGKTEWLGLKIQSQGEREGKQTGGWGKQPRKKKIKIRRGGWGLRPEGTTAAFRKMQGWGFGVWCWLREKRKKNLSLKGLSPAPFRAEEEDEDINQRGHIFCFLLAKRRTHEPREGVVFFLGLRGDGWLKVEDGDGLENGGQKLNGGCFFGGLFGRG
uniref:Uncharacterized protein n=1 Tax=Populus davidiana TaxID=266767 RepID=A0A6M2F8D0_9ROSI